MGTREVYEEKLRNGNLYHDPTIIPGLGSPRCPRCHSLINPPFFQWTIAPVLHDAAAVAGSGAGAMLSAVHGSNTEACEGTQVDATSYWAYALPKFAQLSATSYYTAWTSLHYAMSQLTRYVERAHSSDSIQKS